MSKSRIEWTEETWNPIGGCRKVSPGCKHCYAIRQARRMGGSPIAKIRTRYDGLTTPEPNWSGATFLDEEVLREPLKTRKPTTYFISLSDLFFDQRADEDIDRVFAAIALCAPAGCSTRFNAEEHAQHRFLVLTKYHERMREYFARLGRGVCGLGTLPAVILDACHQILRQRLGDSRNLSWDFPAWPLQNLGLGVSVENLHHDRRISTLLTTPAAMRFVSLEPLLGSMSLRCVSYAPSNRGYVDALTGVTEFPEVTARPHAAPPLPALDWVIVGGESGPGGRPVESAWVRSLRDQCQSAGVPFFFKQWGAWLPSMEDGAKVDGHQIINASDKPQRVGKKAAGAFLDGREWREYPAWMGRTEAHV